jgi:hypothetical protein
MRTLIVSVVVAFAGFAAPALSQSEPTRIFSSVLPGSRTAVAGGDPVTVFATIANGGSEAALNCVISVEADFPGAFTFRAFDGETLQPVAESGEPVDIAPGANQPFVLTFEFDTPMESRRVVLGYECDNAEALTATGLNDVLLSARSGNPPDILVASTPGHALVGVAAGVFVASAQNLNGRPNEPVSIDVFPEVQDRLLYTRLTVCETDPVTSVCISARAESLSVDFVGTSPRTFAVWFSGDSRVRGQWYDLSRIRLNFVDRDTGEIVGQTSAGFGAHGDLECPLYPTKSATGLMRMQVATPGQSGWEFETTQLNLSAFGLEDGRLIIVSPDEGGTVLVSQLPPGDQCVTGLEPVTLSPSTFYQGSLVPGRNSGAPVLSGGWKWHWGLIFGGMRPEIAPGSQFLFRDIRLISSGNYDSRLVWPNGYEDGDAPRAGQYNALIQQGGSAINQAGSWTFTEFEGVGTLTLETGFDGASSTVTCEAHITFSPAPGATFDRTNYDLAELTLQSCAGEPRIEGQYSGALIFQPLLSFGMRETQGLEAVFATNPGEGPHYAFWLGFVPSE